MTTAALAQSTNETNPPAKPTAAQSEPSKPASQTQPSAPASSAGDFVANQATDEWRASKLAGVAVYDADNKKIGAVKEVLMDHSGTAKAVVIGVGGFLGIGEKDIAVPFAALQWQTESRSVPAENTSSNPVTTTGGQPAMKPVDTAAVEANQGYPDKAVLKMSLAQLKAAPDFHYAPSPTAEASQGAEMRSQSHSNPKP